VLGWTINEVRAHSLGDIKAMQLVLAEEDVARKQAARRRK
jgi:hypothetical protein